jgi:hypothetical protein
MGCLQDNSLCTFILLYIIDLIMEHMHHWTSVNIGTTEHVKYSMYELYMYIDEEVDILAPTLSTRVTRT